jgi:hypothetical protein
MQRLNAQIEGGQLILSRNRASYLPSLSVATAMTALMLRGCFLSTDTFGIAKALLVTDLRVVAACLLAACLLLLTMNLSRLRPRIWKFGSQSGQISLNGWPICYVSDLRSIHLDRNYFDTDGSKMDITVLYLRQKNGVNIEIARDGTFGVGHREMEAKAKLICDHLGLAFVMPDRYVSGRAEPSVPVTPQKRWRRKGRWAMQRLSTSLPTVSSHSHPERQTSIPFDAFAEELKRYQFRDWEFEPALTYGWPRRTSSIKVSLGQAPCQRLGVKIRYSAEDNSSPGNRRWIPLLITRFFDVSEALSSPGGWKVWLRGFLWQQVQWILDHEAREQFTYDGKLPLDPHKNTGGTIKNNIRPITPGRERSSYSDSSP